MSTTKARADSLSLLLFTLRSGKLMAINLLKVSEIIPCPPLTKLPESHPHVKGIATLRGASLSVIDLSRALGEMPLQDPDGGCLIVTDVSRSKQGLHVQAVSKIVHCLPGFWDVKPFIAEVQFAMKLNKIYKSKMSIADRNEKFLDAHLTHALHHDAKTIGASKHQSFDKNYLERTGNKDFQRAKGFQSKGLKRSDQVMHERMAERPFLAFEKFNVAKFVEMGRRVYRYNYGTGNSRDRHEPGNMKSRRRGRKKEN